MRLSTLALVTLILGVIPVSAADLTKIDRTIAKEPTYKGKPKYCLLVFGPEAKYRVWLVTDDEALYVDRNGKGDLTDKGNRIPRSKNLNSHVRAGGLDTGDEKTRYKNLIFYNYGTIEIQ